MSVYHCTITGAIDVEDDDAFGIWLANHIRGEENRVSDVGMVLPTMPSEGLEVILVGEMLAMRNRPEPTTAFS